MTYINPLTILAISKYKASEEYVIENQAALAEVREKESWYYLFLAAMAGEF